MRDLSEPLGMRIPGSVWFRSFLIHLTSRIWPRTATLWCNWPSSLLEEQRFWGDEPYKDAGFSLCQGFRLTRLVVYLLRGMTFTRMKINNKARPARAVEIDEYNIMQWTFDAPGVSLPQVSRQCSHRKRMKQDFASQQSVPDLIVLEQSPPGPWPAMCGVGCLRCQESVELGGQTHGVYFE